MENQEIRESAKGRRVCLWQVAERMGISEPTMTRRMRRPLPDAERKAMLTIIEQLAQAKEEC